MRAKEKPTAFIVRYGEHKQHASLFLDYSRALDYAARSHGVMTPLHEPEEVPHINAARRAEDSPANPGEDPRLSGDDMMGSSG